mgnify:CR=1 FL=1
MVDVIFFMMNVVIIDLEGDNISIVLGMIELGFIVIVIWLDGMILEVIVDGTIGEWMVMVFGE